MRAESAGITEVTEQPADRQHASECDDTDDPDWNVAFSYRQRIGLASLARARSGHCTGESLRDRFYQLQQGPDRRDANRTRAEKAYFLAPSALCELTSSGRDIVKHRG